MIFRSFFRSWAQPFQIIPKLDQYNDKIDSDLELTDLNSLTTKTFFVVVLVSSLASLFVVCFCFGVTEFSVLFCYFVSHSGRRLVPRVLAVSRGGVGWAIASYLGFKGLCCFFLGHPVVDCTAVCRSTALFVCQLIEKFLAKWPVIMLIFSFMIQVDVFYCMVLFCINCG